MARDFDAIVVGAGQAGPSLAVRLAAAGRKVAIIERITSSPGKRQSRDE